MIKIYIVILINQCVIVVSITSNFKKNARKSIFTKEKSFVELELNKKTLKCKISKMNRNRILIVVGVVRTN